MIELLYQDGELSRKYLKKGEKMAKENLGAVKGRIDKAFFNKGKSASQDRKPANKSVIDAEKMDDFLKFSDEEDEEEEVEEKKTNKKEEREIESSAPTYSQSETRSSSKRPSFSTSLSSKKVETRSPVFEVAPSSHLADSHASERGSNQANTLSEAELDTPSFETPKQTGRNLMNEYEKNVIPPKEISLNEDEMLQMLAEAEGTEADELTETEISQLLEMDIDGSATKEAKSTAVANEKSNARPKPSIQSTENEEDFDSLIEEINEG